MHVSINGIEMRENDLKFYLYGMLNWFECIQRDQLLKQLINIMLDSFDAAFFVKILENRCHPRQNVRRNQQNTTTVT